MSEIRSQLFQKKVRVGVVTVPIDGFSGQFSAEIVDSNGVPPDDVIRTSDEFYIKCEWHIDGPLARMLCGCWHVYMAFEAVGPGPEFFTDEVTVHFDGCHDGGTGPQTYSAQFVFPGVPDFPGSTPTNPRPKVQQPQGFGVFEVAVILTCRDRCGRPAPIAASANLEKLTIYDAC